MIQKFCKFYKYLFYKFYSWHVFLHDGNYGPDSTSLLTLTFLVAINFLTLLIIIQIITGYKLYKLLEYSKMIVLSPALFFLMINYYIFLNNKKYIKIIKKFQQENRVSKLKGTIYTWLYIVFSFGAMVGAIFLLKYLRPNAV